MPQFFHEEGTYSVVLTKAGIKISLPAPAQSWVDHAEISPGITEVRAISGFLGKTSLLARIDTRKYDKITPDETSTTDFVGPTQMGGFFGY